MNYLKIHNNIISKAQLRGLGVKKRADFEIHHIVPRCLGGLDTSGNLVALTYKEHYLIHVLLIKLHPNHKGLSFAVLQMGGMRWKKSRWYEGARRRHSAYLKVKNTGQGNPMYGRLGPLSPNYGKTCSEETKKKISEAHQGKRATEKARENMSKGQTGISYGPLSEETKSKIRASKQEFLYVTPVGSFISSRLAATALSCSKVTVIKRCRSASPSWQQYKMTEVDEDGNPTE
jgi:hypothetical protein